MALIKNCSKSVPEKSSQIAAEWAELSKEEKEEYQQYADADKIRYFNEMKTYTGPSHVPNKQTNKKQVSCEY